MRANKVQWTDQRERVLLELWAAGCTAGTIAAYFGVSREAILAKIYRLRRTAPSLHLAAPARRRRNKRSDRCLSRRDAPLLHYDNLRCGRCAHLSNRVGRQRARWKSRHAGSPVEPAGGGCQTCRRGGQGPAAAAQVQRKCGFAGCACCQGVEFAFADLRRGVGRGAPAQRRAAVRRRNYGGGVTRRCVH